MTDTVAEKMLKDKISGSIQKLNEPPTGTCPNHGAISDGIKTLLEIKQIELDGIKDNDQSEVNLLGGRILSLKGVKVTGRDVVLFMLIVLVGLVAYKNDITEYLKHSHTEITQTK